MPVVISEIQIVATVADPAGENPPSTPARPAAGNEDQKSEIIKECVEKVMEIIRDQKER
jgi:2,3-bisphosphoglycerate-independent phosphoglycerate mutase